jgi:hypothetical protein
VAALALAVSAPGAAVATPSGNAAPLPSVATPSGDVSTQAAVWLPIEWCEKSPHGSLLCAAKSAHYSQQYPKFVFRCVKLKSNVVLEHLVIV